MSKRIIKFRIFDKTSNQLMIKQGNLFLYESKGGKIDLDFVLNNDNFVVQQFTGLLDKNKKEI